METSLNNIFDSVIIHFSGEIWLKKVWTRKYYEKRLARNLKKTLNHYNIPYTQLIRRHSRFYLRTNSAIEATHKLARVFGISSVSAAIETTSKLEDVIKKSILLAKTRLNVGNSFGVKCKRVGNQDYSSDDVRKLVGQKILDELGKKLDLRVNLGNPDLTLGIEIRDKQAFIYSKTVRGVGGMPLGVQRRLIGLFSGGIDSAVGWFLVMKRGCPVIPIYFDNAPFTDEKTTKRAMKVAEILFSWSIGFPRKIYVVQHGENLKKIMKTNRKFSCLLCKRMMYRIAERLAKRLHTEGIVTGEAIGEQASQTITNLRVLSVAINDYPVHRPLLGFDKAETEALARKIGTYNVSSTKTTGCGVAPYQPSTKAKLEEVLEAEEKLDIEVMLDYSLNSIKIFEL
jgi:thiamine biosynthesis protein ThiI